LDRVSELRPWVARLDKPSDKEIRIHLSESRRMKALVLMLSVLVIVGCSATPLTVTTKRDEFAKTTTVSLENVSLLFNPDAGLTGGPTSLKLTFFRMIDPSYSPVRLVFASWSDNWVYLTCQDLYWLIDDRSVLVRARREPGSVGGDNVDEFISAEMPFEAIESMANAKSVRGRLCSTEFQLSHEQLLALRQFVSSAKRRP